MMTAETVRYGLIGAGMMGREHIRNLALVPGAVVTAVSDPDTEQRTLSAAAAGAARAFASHQELLSSGLVDALVIASPNDTHMAILGDIFAAPKALPVLVEKPVCTTNADCERLAVTAEAHKAPIWVAMEYRYMPPVAELIGEVRAGKLRALLLALLAERLLETFDVEHLDRLRLGRVLQQGERQLFALEQHRVRVVDLVL
jgi:predicted dehydrogenase